VWPVCRYAKNDGKPQQGRTFAEQQGA